jgi:hypothetical protein
MFWSLFGLFLRSVVCLRKGCGLCLIGVLVVGSGLGCRGNPTPPLRGQRVSWPIWDAAFSGDGQWLALACGMGERISEYPPYDAQAGVGGLSLVNVKEALEGRSTLLLMEQGCFTAKALLVAFAEGDFSQGGTLLGYARHVRGGKWSETRTVRYRDVRPYGIRRE